MAAEEKAGERGASGQEAWGVRPWREQTAEMLNYHSSERDMSGSLPTAWRPRFSLQPRWLVWLLPLPDGELIFHLLHDQLSFNILLSNCAVAKSLDTACSLKGQWQYFHIQNKSGVDTRVVMSSVGTKLKSINPFSDITAGSHDESNWIWSSSEETSDSCFHTGSRNFSQLVRQHVSSCGVCCFLDVTQLLSSRRHCRNRPKGNQDVEQRWPVGQRGRGVWLICQTCRKTDAAAS